MSDFDAHPLAPAAHVGPVRTHLGWAVAVSVLCFLPLGLVAVVYGVRASGAVSRGEEERARGLGRVAGRWVVATVIVGILIDLMLIGVVALLGAFSS